MALTILLERRDRVFLQWVLHLGSMPSLERRWGIYRSAPTSAGNRRVLEYYLEVHKTHPAAALGASLSWVTSMDSRHSNLDLADS